MNQTERERLAALIEILLISNKPITRNQRIEAANFLRGYQYLLARTAGEWAEAKRMEADCGIR